MSNETSLVSVYLWGEALGYASWNPKKGHAFFQYEPEFIKKKLKVFPIHMPLSEETYSFRVLDKETFEGLPGLLRSSLPDKFGNALISRWCAENSRENLNPIEKLCYIGNKGLGALEYEPALEKEKKTSSVVDLDNMARLASEISSQREELTVPVESSPSIQDLLTIGSSVGGARAKILIAYDELTGIIYSGQIPRKNSSYWLLKLDGVEDGRETSTPKGYGKIEYAYYLIARELGIEFSESRLFEKNNLHHFMTKRFDRTHDYEKTHMLSLCDLSHFDFRMAGSYSYEQCFLEMRKIMKTYILKNLEQLFRRAVFNVVGRNQDDHTKNISFLMNKSGYWSLAPAYDMTYAYNPRGPWTKSHQMSINGKQDNFTREDLLELAKKADVKKSKAHEIIDRTIEVFSNWRYYANEAKISEKKFLEIDKTFRTKSLMK
ncbi:MAG: type II toxin-antitoxin system HipA family toxin [Candidatus Oxydemutatoraceae bacterium WSBS_2016_MAG_OTU14]